MTPQGPPSALDSVLAIIGLAAAVAGPLVAGDKTAAAIDQAALGLVGIVQAASSAHQAITGEPINLDLLQPIEPLPLEGDTK